MPTFRTDQGDELVQWIAEGVNKAQRKGLLASALAIVGLIQNTLIPAEKPPPVFDRAYTAAWQPEVVDTGCDVVNTIPYASVIEFGGRAENVKIGKAMLDALTDWVLRKGLVGRPKTQTGRAEATINARGIAWAIAKSMQGFGARSGGRDPGMFNRNGNQGLRIAEKATAKAPDIIEKNIGDELRKQFGG